MGANVEPWWHVPGDRPEPSKFARRALRAIFVDAPDLLAVVEYDPVLPVGMGRRQEGAAEGEGHYHKLPLCTHIPGRRLHLRDAIQWPSFEEIATLQRANIVSHEADCDCAPPCGPLSLSYGADRARITAKSGSFSGAFACCGTRNKSPRPRSCVMGPRGFSRGSKSPQQRSRGAILARFCNVRRWAWPRLRRRSGLSNGQRLFATIRADENWYLNHRPGRHPPRWLR